MLTGPAPHPAARTRAIPGQPHCPHITGTTLHLKPVLRPLAQQRPLHAVLSDFVTVNLQPQVWSWEAGSQSQTSSPFQHCQEGRILSYVIRASSLSLAASEAGEPRRSVKPNIPRYSGWGGGHQAPCGPSTAWPPCPSAGLRDCPQMGDPNLLL